MPEVQCTSCGARHEIESSAFGRPMRCRECRMVFFAGQPRTPVTWRERCATIAWQLLVRNPDPYASPGWLGPRWTWLHLVIIALYSLLVVGALVGGSMEVVSLLGHRR
jgi:hypothetical protein